MPYFIVKGRGKESDRKRKPLSVLAKDRDSAIAKAKRQGVVPDSVDLVRVSHYIIEVAGISHPNRDGTDRQAVVKRCQSAETLVLEHEAGNPHDVHAITVCRKNGEQLGYVPADTASSVVEWHRMGCCYSAVVLENIPLGEDTKLRTVRMCIFVALPDINPNCVTEYVSEELAKINPQLPAERFLPARLLETHPWVPAKQRPTRRGAKSEAAKGCLIVLALGLALFSGLSLVGTFIVRSCF